ncbi:MAG: geranylgeranylglyceryl/heptaprenylglyceryl phosphate synthase [Bacteroidales bacterium]|nr:geranylgeranylglyceryl/heptaprenylglyceryl phosphate synthase [Bacteroidales bacterium]
MTKNIYQSILNSKVKKFVLLIDPDKHDEASLSHLLENINRSATDFIFIGGSLVSDRLDYAVNLIKKYTGIPVILFPGNLLQLTDKVDAVLLLSLISGRNPDYLIGNHVLAAPFLKKSNLEIIPTGYILVSDENTSSVEYISNTKPIPSDKTDIVVATAIAGEMLGNLMIYLEAGSGAKKSIPCDLVSAVRKNIFVPLVVGGGIRTADDVRNIYMAGADIVVVGNAFENDPGMLIKMGEVSNSLSVM